MGFSLLQDAGVGQYGVVMKEYVEVPDLVGKTRSGGIFEYAPRKSTTRKKDAEFLVF